MANQVAARLAGDDYQHLVAWFRLLELLVPLKHVQRVTVEDADAGHVDDVTIEFAVEASLPDEFIQVKYHVDHRAQYSTDALLDKSAGGRSLLEKFHSTWRMLTKSRTRPVQLRLLTNWTWDAQDAIAGCIRGHDVALSEEFFTAGPRSRVGIARERWRQHLQAEPEEFEAFARTLRLRLGYDCGDELAEKTAERMMNLKLAHDVPALLVGVGIVREMVKRRTGATDLTRMKALVDAHRLRLPAADEQAVAIYLVTVKRQQFEITPDFLLDWRAHFEGDESKKSHRVRDESLWNQKMLPELIELEQRVSEDSQARVVRARGLARLSAWFAFGFVFSDVARYTLEVDQQGQLWRTDSVPSDFSIMEAARKTVGGGAEDVVAVGISVTGSLDDDVVRHVEQFRTASAVLLIRPERDLGRDCFRSAGDVVAFARAAKQRIRAFAKEQRARRVALFYFGPLSGACFLGHQLNAVAGEIQIMEDQQPGYAPAFVLS